MISTEDQELNVSVHLLQGDSELVINKQHDCARGIFKKVLKFGRIQTNFTFTCSLKGL